MSDEITFQSSHGIFTLSIKVLIIVFCALCFLPSAGQELLFKTSQWDRIPGTNLLTMEGDIASHMIDGIDRFLLGELERSIGKRQSYWHRDFSGSEAYSRSISVNRARLSHILGLRDQRVSFKAPELRARIDRPAKIAGSRSFAVYNIRWPAFGDVHGEGLMLVPSAKTFAGNIIAIPDADQTPEMISGLQEGVPAGSQYARRLAESGFRVFIPVLISRELKKRPRPGGSGGLEITNREFLYRSAYELGRHIIGYELQKILALVDWLSAEKGSSITGILGWGEGGLLSLCAGAVDERISAVMVSGYFDSRQNIWQEPVDRNVFGLLEQFGDAELAGMIVPRTLVIEAAKGPEVIITPGKGGAPGRLITPELNDVKNEVARAKELAREYGVSIHLLVSGDGNGPYGTALALKKFAESLKPGITISEKKDPPQLFYKPDDLSERHDRQFHELDRHSQWLMSESPYLRKEFMKKLNTESADKYEQSSEWYRDFFYSEVIGRFDIPLMQPAACSRKSYDEEKWTGYEVVMDVFPDVIAYGILLLPKDLKQGEKRPVVVCQHGLEGRPQQVISGGSNAYRDFAAKLTERGFITFSPQNLYIFGDRFRTLQRKGNPVKKTLYSVIVPQHQQILDWLSSLPFVDPDRIAFYGLSYGGKTAMRVPPLVKNYCLSICSGDFNEWVRKTASTRLPFSYLWSSEYEINEFDLGSTFNYAEMAALIAPRPFMVERGMSDGVASNEAVAYEFAKVYELYAAKLKTGEKCEIEYFDGPHAINGKGTFDFLHRFLRWPE